MKTLLNTLALCLILAAAFTTQAQSVSNTIDTSTATIEIEDGIATLTWTTKREVNTSYFLVEKSSNGVDYTPVGTRHANSSTMKCSTYQYTDLFDSSAIYYRIKLVTMELNISDMAVINTPASVVATNKAIALK